MRTKTMQPASVWSTRLCEKWSTWSWAYTPCPPFCCAAKEGGKPGDLLRPEGEDPNGWRRRRGRDKHRQWERGGGDGPQDGEGGPRPQRSALFDVAGARPTGNPALHPKQDHCVDEEVVAGAEGGHRPQAARSSPPACRSFFPQRSAQWSPARGGSRGCCPLFLVGGRRQPSSEVVRAPGTQHRQVCYLQRGEPDCETAAAIDVCASSAVVYIIACS
ncbi:uncharacterized protein LOC144139238 [Haemaphysalis longicornis]